MNAARQCSSRSRAIEIAGLILLLTLIADDAAATTQLLLTRGEQLKSADYKGVVELTVNPGVDDAKVTITVDGTKIAEGLRSPYRVTVDFGPNVVEHKIAVTAIAGPKKRIQWTETINKGHLPLTVKVKAIDLANRLFEAWTTAPAEDPIQVVELWDSGKLIASSSAAPHRFTVPEPVVSGGFVQVTARTKSGEEAADFWSAAGDVHVENVQVRTVPIYVSVVDRNGQTRADVDRSSFRVLDNDSEGQIIEFGKAFDQPISIALLLDASASMTYTMSGATKAAQRFVEGTLKEGDRCAVYAIRDVPRRQQELTNEKTAVAKALEAIKPMGRTALFDALQTAIRELRNEKNRRAIVVLTDGSDTASISSYEDVEKIAREAGIPMYFIAYESMEPTAAQDLDRLKFLASQTGGFVATAAEHNLAARYADIEKDLRAQFAIRYQITDYAKRNEWRKVRVVLNSPKLTARTIRGYFAP